MSNILFKNGRIINRGKSIYGDILVKNGRISKVDTHISTDANCEIVDAEGKWIIPGIVDDQVHFREPGLTHKADIASESKAAVAGGVTTFMEMPNTVPSALTQELLEQKYEIARNTSYANYSFFMGASNDNYDEVMKTDAKNVCGVKIFMGSSTGNMLVDNNLVLEKLFSNVPLLIATHCEDELTIKNNLVAFKEKFGDHVTPAMHPLIRDVDACYLSSSTAIALAQKWNTRLHILHISTAKELELFDNNLPLAQKSITAEVCVHHLYFDADDYGPLGNQIKCNPAIKAKENKEALFQALLDDRLDIIATDHAPHTWEEKSLPYLNAPSGLPLVQHSLNIMLDFMQKGKISIEKIIEKMCHAPTDCFQLLDRGYLDEGKYADLVILDPNESWSVTPSNIHYKCGWSPLESKNFKGKIKATYVNGTKVYDDSGLFLAKKGMRLTFDR